MTAPVLTPGQRIRRARRRRGLKQAAAAQLIGRSPGWLSLIENGLLELDSLSAIVALAEVLRCPVAELTDVPVCRGCPRAPKGGRP